MRYLILLTLILTSCSCQKPKLIRIEEVVMHVPLCVQLKGPLTIEQQEAIDRAIIETFEKIDQIYNPFNPTSEVSLINQAPALTPILLSDELARFLAEVGYFVSITDHRFDPSVAPLHKLWLDHLKQGTLPSEQSQLSLQQAIGWDHLSLDRRILYKTHEATGIDLCGIAKGLAVDRLADRLEGLGFKEVYVEWGEITTRGLHPNGRPWKVAILGGGVVELHHLAIATSGSYHQQWTVDDTTYTHIFDLHSQKPLIVKPGVITGATVVMDRCMVADMLATTLMLFETVEEAKAFCQAYFPDAQVWLQILVLENSTLKKETNA